MANHPVIANGILGLAQPAGAAASSVGLLGFAASPALGGLGIIGGKALELAFRGFKGNSSPVAFFTPGPLGFVGSQTDLFSGDSAALATELNTAVRAAGITIPEDRKASVQVSDISGIKTFTKTVRARGGGTRRAFESAANFTEAVANLKRNPVPTASSTFDVRFRRDAGQRFGVTNPLTARNPALLKKRGGTKVIAAGGGRG